MFSEFDKSFKENRLFAGHESNIPLMSKSEMKRVAVQKQEPQDEIRELKKSILWYKGQNKGFQEQYNETGIEVNKLREEAIEKDKQIESLKCCGNCKIDMNKYGLQDICNGCYINDFECNAKNWQPKN